MNLDKAIADMFQAFDDNFKIELLQLKSDDNLDMSLIDRRIANIDRLARILDPNYKQLIQTRTLINELRPGMIIYDHNQDDKIESTTTPTMTTTTPTMTTTTPTMTTTTPTMTTTTPTTTTNYSTSSSTFRKKSESTITKTYSQAIDSSSPHPVRNVPEKSPDSNEKLRTTPTNKKSKPPKETCLVM